MQRIIFVLILCFSAIWLISCENSDTAADNAGCQSNSDCQIGDICVNGACQPGVDNTVTDGDLSGLDGDGEEPAIQGECEVDSDCDDGYVCEDHFCLPSTIVDGDSDGDFTDGDKDEPLDRVPCQRDSDCSDGLFCNGDEYCGDDLYCKEGEPPCDDNVGCTVDECDEDANQCSSSPDDSLCNDGNPCNGPEYCDNADDCQPGPPLDCDDGLACTDDSCTEEDGCLHTPNNALCDDQVPCTSDICSIEDNGCVHVPEDSQCDDGVGCTADRCDPVQGCRHSPSDIPCDDGFSCTTDNCHAQNDCQHAPNHDQCTADEICDPQRDGADATSGCAPRPQCIEDADCDNTLHCDGVETCVDERCVPGVPVDCSDGVDCTEDICNEDTDSCEHPPVDENCQDDTVCNGREVCDAALGCQPGTPLNCNDNIECTEDSCDPANGCKYQPVNSNCNDKVPCTVDSCNPSTGCVHRADNSFCDDLIPCTRNICDAVAGCQYQPNHDYCDDGLDCTTESCSTQYGCTYTADNGVCDDGITCTLDICELGVGCNHLPEDAICDPQICHIERGCIEPPDCDVDSDCNDGSVCNGIETCVNLYCTPGTPLDCNDGVDCTVDSCSPQNGCLHTPNHQICDDFDECTGDYCDDTNGCQHAVVKDSDNDYHIDEACPGGNDCNDNDPDIHPDMAEVCGDTKDNDCNGQTDDQDPVCSPCTGTCPVGMECCNGTCTDITSNKNHCGGCNIPCNTACFKGRCLAPGKCADALNNLITANVRYDNRNTCGSGNDFISSCAADGSGQDHIYAIKPIDGNPMVITQYPGGTEINREVVYAMTDCTDPSSCFASEYGNLNYNTLDIAAANGGDIFFVVADFSGGQCGTYDIKIDYDNTSSDCNQGALLPLSGRGTILAGILIWLAILTLVWTRRREN